MQKTLLTFVEDIYEDLELWYPKLRCEEAGYAMRVAAPDLKAFTGKHGYPAKSDLLLKDADSKEFRGLLVPGGSCRTNCGVIQRFFRSHVNFSTSPRSCSQSLPWESARH